MVDIQTQLKDHLKNAVEWEKMETPIPGVFVVKVPATKSRPALLFLEINPLDDDGKPIKKKGLFISNYDMALRFYETLRNEKLFKLLTEVEKVNPEVEGTLMKKLEM